MSREGLHKRSALPSRDAEKRNVTLPQAVSVYSRRETTCQDEGHRFLSAVYIDHGHMFGGPDGSQKTRLRACMHLDLRVYDGLGVDDDLDYWISRIEDQGETIIANAVASIPEEWRSSRIEKNVDHLWTNLPKLRDLLMPAVFQFRAATAVAS